MTTICALSLLPLVSACRQTARPPAIPGPDPCAAKVGELTKENNRLREELTAAHHSSSTMDETLRSVEHDLDALVGLDTDLRNRQRSLETGQNVRSRRSRLKEYTRLVQDRVTLLAQAERKIAELKKLVGGEEASRKITYLKEITRLETVVKSQQRETTRLEQERDEYAKRYHEAAEEASTERTGKEEATAALATEKAAREEAERLENRVFVILATKSTLRRKGLLSGRLRWTKSNSCECDGCRTEEDRRKLAELPIPAPKANVTVFSMHGKDSYALEPRGTTSVLTIRDTNSFWGSSRCLVVGY